uniref:Reverse transcriptase domain-containing protein n=1 Tax=Seriola dumerili TaxID=41447 RepID=A0A3B4TB02_SERDU
MASDRISAYNGFCMNLIGAIVTVDHNTVIDKVKWTFIVCYKWQLFLFCPVSGGVPQGSILGPVLLVTNHFYADDTSLNPNDFTVASSVNKWMSSNFLKLNEEAKEILQVGHKSKRDMLFDNLGNELPGLNLRLQSLCSLKFRSEVQVLHQQGDDNIMFPPQKQLKFYR